MTPQQLTLTERKEIGAMQMRLNELFACADREPNTYRALERASSWLNNINDPLVDTELEAWFKVSEDVLAQMDNSDYTDQMTAEDIRGAIRYMADE